MNNFHTSTIQVTRPSDDMARWRAYGLYVDGKRVGKIRCGETVNLNVSPGPHVLHARIDLIRGNRLHVGIDSGQSISVAVVSKTPQRLIALAASGWPFAHFFFLRASGPLLYPIGKDGTVPDEFYRTKSIAGAVVAGLAAIILLFLTVYLLTLQAHRYR